MKLKEAVGGVAAVAVALGVLFFAVFGIKGCASQSGMFSRWTGTAVVLPMPKDCVRVINFGKTGKTKYLSYLNSKGEVVLHEYSDHGILEATYKIEGTFDANLTKTEAPSPNK
jgi:hypothetical protein